MGQATGRILTQGPVKVGYRAVNESKWRNQVLTEQVRLAATEIVEAIDESKSKTNLALFKIVRVNALYDV